MDDQHHHQSHFDSALPIYYTRLKEAYQEGVKTAVDKEYAKDYYQTILCEQNEAIPSKTIFFATLRYYFDHFEKLFGETAVLRTLEHLETVRQNSREALTLIERYCEGGYDYLELPVHYEDQLDVGESGLAIIEQERMVLTLSDRQVVEILALHSATRKLLKELHPGTASYEVELPSEIDKRDRFTRSQQVLVLYYLLKALGVTDETAKISDCARLLHKLVGVPEPVDMSNSDIYKMFKRPHGDFDRKTIKNLRAILPYFEKLPCYPVINSINEHLRDCNGD